MHHALNEMSMSLKILTLSSLYPGPGRPMSGIFVRHRVLHMAAAGAIVKVISPVELVNYASRRPRWGGHVVSRWNDGPVEVLHPRWFYPPLVGFVNPFCLTLGTLGLALRLRREFPFQARIDH